MSIRQQIVREGIKQKYTTKLMRVPVDVEAIVYRIADAYRLNPTPETIQQLDNLTKDLENAKQYSHQHSINPS